jgi:hypothetical protein
MKKVILVLAAGMFIGAMAAQAKLPPAPPKSDADKAAEAHKAAASKEKDAADLAKAQDRAVANYKKKNPAAMGKEAKSKK